MTSRVFLYLLKLLVFLVIVIALAEQPGDVRFTWLGYEVRTSVAFLIITLLVAGYALWRIFSWLNWMSQQPGAFRARRANHRMRVAQRKLGQGFAAIAAGDRKKALALSRTASRALPDSSLAIWLAAQAAVLAGDDKAAAKHYRALAADSDMAALGQHGLLRLAAKRGDISELQVLSESRKAVAAGPMLHLSALVRERHWLEAARLVEHDKKLRAKFGSAAAASVYVEAGRQCEAHQNFAAASRWYEMALKEDPGLVPATLALSQLKIRHEEFRAARKLLIASWDKEPHPDVLEEYMAQANTNALEQLRDFEKSFVPKPRRTEDEIALARLSLRARLWGKARQHAESAVEFEPSRRVYQLLAEIAESESGDLREANQWLKQAATALPEPQWVCSSCGHAEKDWHGTCPNCHQFGRMSFLPPHMRRDDMNALALGFEDFG